MPTVNSNNSTLDEQLNRAIKLTRQNKFAQAEKILKELSRTYPRSAAVWGYLGGVLMETNRIKESASAFDRASQLSPKSELARLGLFHSLWKLGAGAEAFAEMRRFLSLKDSTEYATLLRDLAVEGRLIAQPQTAGGA